MTACCSVGASSHVIPTRWKKNDTLLDDFLIIHNLISKSSKNFIFYTFLIEKTPFYLQLNLDTNHSDVSAFHAIEFQKFWMKKKSSYSIFFFREIFVLLCWDRRNGNCVIVKINSTFARTHPPHFGSSPSSLQQKI